MVYHTIYITLLIILSFMLLACMAVNMMGTMVMVMIAVLALMLKEGYLVDICLIYAMISFLAVVVLSKVYIGVYEEKHRQKKSPDEGTVKEELSDGNV